MVAVNGRALTVGKVGALSDLDNITIRIAHVAADLAVLGDRLRDELGSPSSLRPQALHGIHQRRFHRLKTDGNDGNSDCPKRRPEEYPSPQADAVVVAVQPMLQKVKRDGGRDQATDTHQDDKIFCDEHKDLRYGGAEHLSDADLPGTLLGDAGDQPKEPQAGDKDGQGGKNAGQPAD